MALTDGLELDQRSWADVLFLLRFMGFWNSGGLASFFSSAQLLPLSLLAQTKNLQGNRNGQGSEA